MAPSKFSFHLHHRRHRADKDKEPERLATPAYSVRSDDVSSQPTKAERLLGTGLPGRRVGSAASVAVASPFPPAPHSLLDTKQTYMSSLSLPEGGRKGSTTSADDLVPPPRWQSHTLYHRPSSNVLGPSAAADEGDGEGRSGSVSSAGYSKTLHSHKSSTTLQSHYDSRKSPLSVSQQTSASAMRDGGLRRGHTPLHQSTTSVDQASTHSSTYDEYDNESGKASRKKKPARLDLSKLFPKAPKAKSDNILLPPSLFVSSPVPLYSSSQHYPQSLSPDEHSERRAPSFSSTKTGDTFRDNRSVASSQKDKSQQPENYDNAKINIRRPPAGIQHWFEGLSDDSDEAEDEQEPARGAERDWARAKEVFAQRREPETYGHERQPSNAGRKTSEQSIPENAWPLPPQPHVDYNERSHFSLTTRASDQIYSPNEPDQIPASSNPARNSKKPKAGKNNKIAAAHKHGASVLSLSSSEDESDSPNSDLPEIRDSLAMSTETVGEILIGKAQAFELKPLQERLADRKRMTSMSDSSVRTSTTAATIDVMLSPTARSSQLMLPRHSRSGRKPRHSRQVSAIPEDDYDEENGGRRRAGSFENGSDYNDHDTNSIRSNRTSKSEPRSHLGHKLMAVTEEEEVLLELMRRKRAAMAKHSYAEGYRSAVKAEQYRSNTSSPQPSEKEQERKRSKKALAPNPYPTQWEEDPPTTTETLVNSYYRRNRQSAASDATDRKSNDRESVASPPSHTSQPQDGVATGRNSRNNNTRVSRPPQLSPAVFSPLDIFPSPPDSPTYPATASHTDTLPSPVTPGPGAEGDLVSVKVAGSSVGGGSESSFGGNGADVDAVFPLPGQHGQNGAHVPAGKEKHHHHQQYQQHQHQEHHHQQRQHQQRQQHRESSHSRRRTASSDAGMDFSVPPPLPSPSTMPPLPPLPPAPRSPPAPPPTKAIPPVPTIQPQQRDHRSHDSARDHHHHHRDAPSATSRGEGEPNTPAWGETDASVVIEKVRRARSSSALLSSPPPQQTTHMLPPGSGQSGYRSARTSTSSVSTNATGNNNYPGAKAPRQSQSQNRAVSTGSRRSSVSRNSGLAAPGIDVATRSSVSEDVLAAWGSLGGGVF